MVRVLAVCAVRFRAANRVAVTRASDRAATRSAVIVVEPRPGCVFAGRAAALALEDD